MDRRALLASAVLMAAAGGCGGLGRRAHTVRFKLSARVSVSGREHIGASINQVRWIPSSGAGPVNTGEYRTKLWAEAPVIDLGSQGLLFALLQPPMGYRTERAFNFFRPNAYLLQRLPLQQLDLSDLGPLYEQLSDLEGDFPLRPQELPVLLRFGDINDPLSAEVIEHANIQSAYGRGAAFLGGAISISREPLTRSIERTLPWLRRVPPQSGDTIAGTNRFGDPVSTRLMREHFQLKGFEP